MAQILNSRSGEGTLLQVDGEAIEATEVKHKGDVADERPESWRKPLC